MEFLKKTGLKFWLCVAAGVMALVGAILFMVTNSSAGYEVENGGAGVAFSIIAVLLIACAAYFIFRSGRGNVASAAMTFVALVLLMVVIGMLLLNRANLASGLFTWESSNLVGWKVFYVSIAGMVFLFLSVILLIVGAFFGEKKAVNN